MARVCQHTQELLAVIKQLQAEGMSQREIAWIDKVPVHWDFARGKNLYEKTEKQNFMI